MLRASSQSDEEEATGTVAWLQRFHAGDRRLIEAIYREHFDTVARATAVLSAADRETAIHEIFLRLLTQDHLRASFRGGSLAAWLTVISRNHAIDCMRRRSREVPAGSGVPGVERGNPGATEATLQARVLIDRFRREILPPKWAGVFEARFVEQQSQSEAAASLRISRTTLAYQESRVRLLLRDFLLGGGR
jgi:RNA polymerase sigma-70 factor, ECF subfamily